MNFQSSSMVIAGLFWARNGLEWTSIGPNLGTLTEPYYVLNLTLILSTSRDQTKNFVNNGSR
jgi:hypothetical protein